MNLPPPSLSAEPPRQDSRNLLTRFLKDSERFLETTNFETCRVLLGRRSGHWCEHLSPECTDGCVTLTVPWVELVEVLHLRSATPSLERSRTVRVRGTVSVPYIRGEISMPDEKVVKVVSSSNLILFGYVKVGKFVTPTSNDRWRTPLLPGTKPESGTGRRRNDECVKRISREVVDSSVIRTELQFGWETR